MPASTLLAGLLVAALLGGCVAPRQGDWWLARRDSSGQAPDAAVTPEAVVQIYAARAVGWRGLLGVHTWIAVKRADASAYTRYEVIGWGVERGIAAIRVNRTGPDNYWFGARPDLLLDRRGEGVNELIDRVEAAIAAYPYQDEYRLLPGPNTNPFTGIVGRLVPRARLQLPSTAIGKDYLPGGALVALTPARRRVQLSLFGVVRIRAGS